MRKVIIKRYVGDNRILRTKFDFLEITTQKHLKIFLKKVDTDHFWYNEWEKEIMKKRLKAKKPIYFMEEALTFNEYLRSRSHIHKKWKAEREDE